MLRRILTIAALVTSLLFVAAPAGAITFGELDGNDHPNVGALVAKWRGDRTQLDILCSGTLISPHVYLTAAHCTAFLESLGISDVWVSFDSEFDPDTSTLFHGTMHTNPDYNQAQNDPGDIAVIVLDQAVKGITPASLPSEELFDRMSAQNGLKDQKFMAVGYGSHQMQVGGGPWTFPFLGVRERAVSEFNAINDAWLRLSQNNATGDGGTCYGDSGGPNFLGAGDSETDIISGITVTGDVPCFATNVIYRLDTPQARAFLEDFVTLP